MEALAKLLDLGLIYSTLQKLNDIFLSGLEGHTG